jgi:hypothetical protein
VWAAIEESTTHDLADFYSAGGWHSGISNPLIMQLHGTKQIRKGG